MGQMELKQSLKLSQQLIMTPRLQLAIKMLTLNNFELSEIVKQEIAENPIINDDLADFNEKTENDESIENDAIIDNGQPKLLYNDSNNFKAITDYIINYDEQLSDLSVNVNLNGKQDKNYIIENTLTTTETLYEFIMNQVRTGDFAENEIKLAEYIAGNLDSNGFLILSKQELISYAKDLSPLLDNLLYKISRLEPVGIASYDTTSSLLVQADYFFPEDELLKNIIKNHLKDVANANYHKISKETNVELNLILNAINRLKTLNPRPAANFEQSENNYIIPDLFLKKEGGKYTVVMIDDYIPPIKINSYYKKILKGELISNGITKNYIEDKLKSAMWLIKSITTRKETILKIAQIIVDRERDFFDNGRGHLKPLILTTIADELHLHESTISRATSNKYLSTNSGIFELKSFFSGSAYGDISSDYIMVRIKQIIAQEKSAGKIYCDNDIMEILKKEGIDIARRTISKYREIMDIPPSNKRK